LLTFYFLIKKNRMGGYKVPTVLKRRKKRRLKDPDPDPDPEIKVVEARPNLYVRFVVAATFFTVFMGATTMICKYFNSFYFGETTISSNERAYCFIFSVNVTVMFMSLWYVSTFWDRGLGSLFQQLCSIPPPTLIDFLPFLSVCLFIL
jgi:hypothetical protein